MYGISEDGEADGRDMTAGPVHGVYIMQGEQCAKGTVFIGFL